MEELKAFLVDQTKLGQKHRLIGALILPIASVVFFISFALTPPGTAIVLPSAIALVLVYGIFLSPYLIFAYFKNRHPEKSGLYRLLLSDPSNVKGYSIKRSYGTYIFTIKSKEKIWVKSLIIRNKPDAEKFLDLLRKVHPEATLDKY